MWRPKISWFASTFAREEKGEFQVDIMFREYPAGFDGKIRTVREGYPTTKKALYKYDVIINSDIPATHFSEKQMNWTANFVTERGGGFLMIGGWNAFGEGGYVGSTLEKILPVVMNSKDTHADGVDFTWKNTELGWEHPIMQIDSKPLKNRKIWVLLNTLGKFNKSFHGYSKVIRSKPQATTLAVIGEEELESIHGPMPLLVVQKIGKGRSMAFTTDSTGGWGAEWEDSWGDDQKDPKRRNAYFKIFWQNAIRWLAGRKKKQDSQGQSSDISACVAIVIAVVTPSPYPKSRAIMFS